MGTEWTSGGRTRGVLEAWPRRPLTSTIRVGRPGDAGYDPRDVSVNVRAAARPPRSALVLGLFFLAIWLLYGVLIQEKNQRDFGLQQTVIEAIVERGRFYMEGGRAPELGPRYDVSVVDGHKYAAKQPGQFLFGSIPYFFLYRAGIGYYEDFVLASAVVTFFTASLAVAAGATAMLYLAGHLVAPNRSRLWPLATALTLALGTTALPYAGIAHHDAIAMGLLVLALALAFRLHRTWTPSAARWLALGIGLLLGLTFTTSGTATCASIVIAAYTVFSRHWRLVPFLAAGGVIGLGPMLYYNWVSFKNPFLLSYVAGNWTGTYWHWNWPNFRGKVLMYGDFVRQYVPIAIAGVLGYALFPKHLRREQLAGAGIIAAYLAFLLNIRDGGDCQYGPRYLLTAMPFAAMGLIGYSYLAPGRARTLAIGALAVLGGFSVAVNLVGAIGGAMYCQIQVYAFPRYIARFVEGKVPDFPLAGWLVLPLVALCVGFALAYWRADGRGPRRTPSYQVRPATT